MSKHAKPRRRAGLLPDERDPDEPPRAPGSATGGIHAAGSMEGGAAGGLAGTNTGDGEPDDAEIEDSLGSSESDRFEDDDQQGEPPFAGRAGGAGGAVGGTPAEKRAKGGLGHR